jgi:hypothetical protein
MSPPDSYKIPIYGDPLTAPKKTLVVIILAFLLLVAGSMFTIDWMIFIFDLQGVIAAAVMKALTSFTSFILVLLIGRNYLDKRDRNFLLLAFCCMVPIDIITSSIGVFESLDVSGGLFMVAGVLSIIAHIILAIRHGRGFPYLKKTWAEIHGKQTLLQKYWILAIVFVTAILAMILLWEDMVRINHQVIGPVYTIFFCINTWVAWETVRYRLYPRANALLAALAMTGWYLTEIVGEISNIQIGVVSDIAFNLVWVFYGANVILVALSGYRWE